MPEPILIDAPARCAKCGVTYQSPTTGKLMNVCHCGGELKPRPTDAELRRQVDDAIKRICETQPCSQDAVDYIMDIFRPLIR